MKSVSIYLFFIIILLLLFYLFLDITQFFVVNNLIKFFQRSTHGKDTRRPIFGHCWNNYLSFSQQYVGIIMKQTCCLLVLDWHLKKKKGVEEITVKFETKKIHYSGEVLSWLLGTNMSIKITWSGREGNYHYYTSHWGTIISFWICQVNDLGTMSVGDLRFAILRHCACWHWNCHKPGRKTCHDQTGSARVKLFFLYTLSWGLAKQPMTQCIPSSGEWQRERQGMVGTTFGLGLVTPDWCRVAPFWWWWAS